MGSTWLARELPILRAVITAEEAGGDPHAAAKEAACQLTDVEFMKCLDRLREDGLLDVAVLRGDGGRLQGAHLRRVLPRALREVGLWPRAATPLEEKKRRRLEFMQRLYQVTERRTLNVVSIDRLAAALGWSHTEAAAVVEYLSAEALIEPGMGNQASITHDGVVEVEEALEDPSRPTEHFPAVNLVMVQGSVVGSQIQAGTIGSEQQQEVLPPEPRDLSLPTGYRFRGGEVFAGAQLQTSELRRTSAKALPRPSCGRRTTPVLIERDRLRDELKQLAEGWGRALGSSRSGGYLAADQASGRSTPLGFWVVSPKATRPLGGLGELRYFLVN